MQIGIRTGRAASLLSATVLFAGLAACEPAGHVGYEKVVDRGDKYIQPVAYPEPPPVVALASSAAPEIDFASIAFPASVTAAQAEEGQELYGTVCAACHGAGGGGSAAAPSLNDAEWLNVSGNYDEIVNIIHTGVPNPKQYPGAMPALGGGNFNDDQVRAIAAYVFALSHASS